MPRYATDRETLERETDVSFQRRGGPGGQHQNKVETAVRLHHRPSGIRVVSSRHRSQSRNRDAAFERLAERLRLLNHRPKRRVATRPSRAARRRRLENKRQRGAIKRDRKKPGTHE